MSSTIGATSTGGGSPGAVVGTPRGSAPGRRPVTAPERETPRGRRRPGRRTRNSTATMASPRATNSASRRAESGRRLARSSTPFGSRRAGHGEGDRLGEQAGLGGQRLAADGVDAEAKVRAAKRLQPRRQAGPRRVHQLDAPLGRRVARGQRDAHVVERHGQTDHLVHRGGEDRASPTETSGLPCAAFSSIARPCSAYSSARAPPPGSAAALRKVSGSCRFRAAPSSQR